MNVLARDVACVAIYVGSVGCNRQHSLSGSECERRVRTVREECLDRLIILNERHLRRVLQDYVVYYNARRPHHGLDQDSALRLWARSFGL